MSEQKKIWMVRVGDHVCGPYETAAIESLIQEQEISEIDEIALPCRGWNYVRDRGEFLNILEKLKSTSFAKPGSGSSSLTATSITGTENITQLTNSGKTEELTYSRTEDTKTAPLVDFNGLGAQNVGGGVPGVAPSNQAVIAGVNKPNQKKKFSLVAVVAVLIVVAIAVLFGPEDLDYNPLSLLSNQGQKTFKLSWASGDFDQSFKILQGDKGLLNENRNKYVALLLMRGNEFNLAEKTLELATDKVSADWKNLRGLSDHYRGQDNMAESFYLSVLKESSDFIPSLINLGHLKREAGEWSLARSYFESAFSKIKGLGYDDVPFYLLESWMRQSLAETGVSNLDNINAYLQNQMVGHSTYMHEFKLLELWISATRSSWREKEEKLVKAFLDLDPQVLVSRKVSPYTYKLEEGALAYLCQDLDSKLKATRYKTAAIALCHIVDKNYDLALNKLEQDFSEEYSVSLHSFVARLNKDLITADEQLVKAMEFTKNEANIKFFMQARFCYDKGDMKCAAEYWMKGLERDPDAYTAHVGLAQSYFQVEDYDKARNFMQRAEGFAKSYGPLIELQMLMKEVTN